jgi:hypothetical protein
VRRGKIISRMARQEAVLDLDGTEERVDFMKPQPD